MLSGKGKEPIDSNESIGSLGGVFIIIKVYLSILESYISPLENMAFLYDHDREDY